LNQFFVAEKILETLVKKKDTCIVIIKQLKSNISMIVLIII